MAISCGYHAAGRRMDTFCGAPVGEVGESSRSDQTYQDGITPRKAQGGAPNHVPWLINPDR